jgi:ATP-dependent Clp protease adaptor protein ClpS
MSIEPHKTRHPTALGSECAAFCASGPPDPPGKRPAKPPSPPAPGRPQHEGEEGVDVEDKPKSAVPRRYQVVFHNDDYTTMEFVILALTKFFHKNETESLHLMLTIHRKGSGIAGIYPRDVAETKVEQVTSFAREHGMPLLVTAEPE